VASTNGHSILIGGNHTGGGAATLQGGNAGDLIIAGTTTYDTNGPAGGINLAALNAIMAEWSNANVAFATRVAHITGTQSGGRNGTTYLRAGTEVLSSNSLATINAGTSPSTAAIDLVFDSGDTVNDFNLKGRKITV